MNCNQIRDLILTDYLDERLSGRTLNELKDHLLKCAACREFERVARQAAVEPFEGLPVAKTPETVWQNIRELITEEDRRFSPSWAQLWGTSWKKMFGFRPAVAWAGLIPVLILAFVVVQHVPQQKVAKGNDKEKVEYLAYMMGYPETASRNEDNGYGTDIEAMFL
ncbi:MAG: zf-HC2 domain-containing protein [Candidatus Omnitrophota bacterium]|jgi:predicted anti-sigma-YlaC factor YlaD